MPAEKTEQLNAIPAAGPSGAEYGVAHVAKRIELMYGPLYGLCFRSDPGKGTSVTIRLPLDRNSAAKNPSVYSRNPDVIPKKIGVNLLF